MNVSKVLEQFEKDVENHSLVVLKDEGVYRHLRFSDGTSVYRFDIITWPGSLCISGDMGCQVFERLEDMFEFFRSDSKDIKINPYYWSEKSEAGTIKEFDQESFNNSIKNLIDELKQNLEDDLAKDEMKRVIEELEEVKNNSYDLYEAVEAIRNIDNLYYDCFESIVFEDYTYRYIWRLFAIVWGIQKYDNYKNVLSYV